jgi:biotin synthase
VFASFVIFTLHLSGMADSIENILSKDTFSIEDIISLLLADAEERSLLFRKSAEIKEKYIGKKVWLRGLIEFSNLCGKNCLYCGIRKGNKKLERYNLSDDEILAAAKFAFNNRYGSITLQSGELESPLVTNRIENLLHKIKELSNGELGITLSVGEQEPEVYKRWFDAGAHRYLLRIEASNPELYKKIHPDNKKHDYKRRLNCLESLQDIGYQVGTGVMVGLPFQTIKDLADDLIFMRDFDIDMCGMGPYIEHADTPLIEYADKHLPLTDRFDLTLKMIAILRIMMKDINMVAATALQAIVPTGREKAIKIGANVIMPNITPGKYRDDYSLYANKPCTDDSDEDSQSSLEARLSLMDSKIIYGEWGDTKHYENRLKGLTAHGQKGVEGG